MAQGRLEFCLWYSAGTTSIKLATSGSAERDLCAIQDVRNKYTHNRNAKLNRKYDNDWMQYSVNEATRIIRDLRELEFG